MQYHSDRGRNIYPLIQVQTCQEILTSSGQIMATIGMGRIILTAGLIKEVLSCYFGTQK